MLSRFRSDVTTAALIARLVRHQAVRFEDTSVINWCPVTNSLEGGGGDALPVPDIGVDAESGLVHTVQGTAANVHDIASADALLHGKRTVVYCDAGYRGIQKCTGAKAVDWMVAMCPG